MPTITRADFTQVLYDSTWLSELNPTLTSGPMTFDLLLYWHGCCVLEDKLERLCSFRDDILGELRVKRTFDPVKHPYWLAFEVENRLQIRPEQALIALLLINSPGDIVQLNMGLGKTRVVLPLLVLHWTSSDSLAVQRVTRLNVLPNLIAEATDYFFSTLNARLSGTKIVMLPFCRDVALDDRKIAAMKALLTQCQISRGIVMASPEHKHSLELKTIELRRSGQDRLAGLLENGVHNSKLWREVLDESDELLHHRFRLIYATGAVSELPESVHRYRAHQGGVFEAQLKPKREILDAGPPRCHDSRRRSDV